MRRVADGSTRHRRIATGEGRGGGHEMPCYLADMNDRRPDFPPVGHPLDYLRGLVAFIVLVGAILALAFIVRLVLPA